MFNDQKWNDSNLQSTIDVLDELVDVKPALALQHLLAFGGRDRLTILHVVLDPESYEIEYKLTTGLRLFIRFLLELEPSLPILTDKKGRTPLLQALSEASDREDEADAQRGLTLAQRRDILNFFCESKNGLEIGYQKAVESLTMVAKEPKLHAIHLAIQSSITVPKEAIEGLDPKGDDRKAAWLDQKDKYGRTCLHLALTAPFTTEKLWWAEKVTFFRPKVLGITFEATTNPQRSVALETKKEVRSRLLTPLHLFSQQIEEENKRRKAARSLTQRQPSTTTMTELSPDSQEISQTQDLLKHQCLRTFEDEETCKQYMYIGANG